MARPRKSNTSNTTTSSTTTPSSTSTPPQGQAPTDPTAALLPDPNSFRMIIEELMTKHQYSYLEAIIEWAESKNLCPSDLGVLCRRCGMEFVQAIKEEASSLNLLKVEGEMTKVDD